MTPLSFRQTRMELMLRTAATLLFGALKRSGTPVKELGEVIEGTQYGYTASASSEPVGPRLVRITDLKDGSIDWANVPYCDCGQPDQYMLSRHDILFARTGATTGKTHLVTDLPAERAIFASYLVRVRPTRDVLPGYLAAFFLSDLYWEQILEQKGGSAQANVNAGKLCRLHVPVADPATQQHVAEFMSVVSQRSLGTLMELPSLPPPLSDQRRIFERIDALAMRIDEAKRLNGEVAPRIKELTRSLIRGAAGGAVRHTPMAQLVTLREPDVIVEPTEIYQFAGVYCFGRGVFAGSPRSGSGFKYPRLTRLRVNNFVYPKLMAWEGALAIVPPECDGLVVSTEYPVFEVHEEKVLPEVLDVHFRTPSIWPQLSGSSTGTNVRRRRLKPADFLRYSFPLPSMATQRRLRAIKQKADAIDALRRQRQLELDAILRALLDRHFE